MNDELDLPHLQFIILEYGALNGDSNSVDSNYLIMKSIDNDMMINKIFLLFLYSKDMVTISTL